jgi:hypothetical protein
MIVACCADEKSECGEGERDVKGAGQDIHRAKRQSKD